MNRKEERLMIPVPSVECKEERCVIFIGALILPVLNLCTRSFGIRIITIASLG